MKLYLVQHGEATTEEINKEKPLTKKGISDVNKIATFLRDAGISVNSIFHSTKLRAKESAKILADILNPECQVIEKNSLSPNDSVENIYAEILERTDDLMIVGHLPFLSKLVSKLILYSEDKSIIRFRQGGIARLERNDTGSWEIDWFITPDLLREES
ncbi:MAG TPA: phosphohistidine phosphatase SixA [Nitrospinota bacterium]|nr:phosphohistidine phosphatase SixA [Nitrospinota bacterium]